MNRRSFFGFFAIPFFPVFVKPERGSCKTENGVFLKAHNCEQVVRAYDVVRYNAIYSVDGREQIAAYLNRSGEFVGVAREDILPWGYGYIQISGLTKANVSITEKSRKPKRKTDEPLQTSPNTG